MKALAIAILALFVGQPIKGQHQRFTVNPGESNVSIQLNTTHEVVNGTFHLRSGSIDFDLMGAHISGIVVVEAGSGKTGNNSRDKKMNRDILKVEQFTDVSFSPKTFSGKIAALGDSNIQVSGIFTLLGTAHNLTIPMQIHIDGPSVAAKAHFFVPYVQWGLKNPSFLFWKADDDVNVDLNLVGQLSK